MKLSDWIVLCKFINPTASYTVNIDILLETKEFNNSPDAKQIPEKSVVT